VGRGATFETGDAASLLVARVAHRPINLQNETLYAKQKVVFILAMPSQLPLQQLAIAR